MNSMIGIILAIALAQLPEPVIFDTVVTQVKPTWIELAWECADKPGQQCTAVINRDLWATGSFRYWPKEVERGQLLKATFFVGQLKSIPGCEERLLEAAHAHTQGLGGKTPTNSLMPEDCSRMPTPFIRDLLEKTAPQELKN